MLLEDEAHEHGQCTCECDDHIGRSVCGFPFLWPNVSVIQRVLLDVTLSYHKMTNVRSDDITHLAKCVDERDAHGSFGGRPRDRVAHPCQEDHERSI